MRNVCALSATKSKASRLRSILSVRQSFANSTAARFKLPACCSSLVSKRAKRLKASAVEPANPAKILSWKRRRIFLRVLEHVVAEGHLAIGGHHNLTVAPHTNDGGGVNAGTYFHSIPSFKTNKRPGWSAFDRWNSASDAA